MNTTSTDASPVPPLASNRWATLRHWLGRPGNEIAAVSGFYFVLTFLVFARVLFGPADHVLSSVDTDLAQQFVPWRTFGFEQLRAGHLALWNPHIYGGSQYFGGFQAALLYPPNWLYLFLPLPLAINTGIALHVFLAGTFMFLWVRHRGIHPLAATLAGVLFMFSGPYFVHIYAGHLPNLCTMVWGPLVLLAIDGWLERRTTGWILLGAGVTAMQIMAGHPQYVFYTGIAAGIYCVPNLVRARHRWSATAGLAAMALGAVALSAVQLFEGFHAAGESVRSRGLSESFAAVFSFPPENLLTLVVPNFFGDMTHHAYWGRCYLWEMSAFFGITGLVLAIYCLVAIRTFEVWVCAGVALLLGVLALGAHTPLFHLLFYHAPGFNKFRGWSKFTYPALMFLVMLAAMGFDVLLRRGVPARGLTAATLGAALVVCGVALWAGWSADSGTGTEPQPWTKWLNGVYNSGECYVGSQLSTRPGFTQAAGKFAAEQLRFAAGTFLVLGLFFLLCRRWREVIYVLPLIALAEMLTFALPLLNTFTYHDGRETTITKYLAALPPGDYRVLNLDDPNGGMNSGLNDVWGYDPGVLKRYAEWIAATQRVKPEVADQNIPFSAIPKLYASMLRCQFIFSADRESYRKDPTKRQILTRIFDATTVAPHVMLVSQVKQLAGRNDIFNAMLQPEFDPRWTVILESPPVPPPADFPSPGKASVKAETTDSLTIEADLPEAAVMVITDAYSDGWRVRSLLKPAREVASNITTFSRPITACAPFRSGRVIIISRSNIARAPS